MATYRQCVWIKPDGQRCGTAAMKGADHCYRHNPSPAVAALRQENDQKGGVLRAKQRDRAPLVLPPDTPDVELVHMEQIAQLLARSINQALRGELDFRICNAINNMAGNLVRVLGETDFEKRLAAVEANQKAREEALPKKAPAPR